MPPARLRFWDQTNATESFWVTADREHFTRRLEVTHMNGSATQAYQGESPYRGQLEKPVEGGVTLATGKLDKSIEMLAQVVEVLESRLSGGGVLRPDPPRAIGKDSVEQSRAKCDLASSLDSYTGRIHANRERLDAILTRLDL
jgi:hypothetical protein